MRYFSEREQGERSRESEAIGEGAWGGIQALLRSRVEDGSFGATYPETCEDGAVPVGTDQNSLAKAVRAEIPAFAEPPWYDRSTDVPDTLDILDPIEFSWRAIGRPIKGGYRQVPQGTTERARAESFYRPRAQIGDQPVRKL